MIYFCFTQLEKDFELLHPGNDGMLFTYNAAAPKLWNILLKKKKTQLSGLFEDIENSK